MRAWIIAIHGRGKKDQKWLLLNKSAFQWVIFRSSSSGAVTSTRLSWTLRAPQLQSYWKKAGRVLADSIPNIPYASPAAQKSPAGVITVRLLSTIRCGSKNPVEKKIELKKQQLIANIYLNIAQYQALKTWLCLYSDNPLKTFQRCIHKS